MPAGCMNHFTSSRPILVSRANNAVPLADLCHKFPSLLVGQPDRERAARGLCHPKRDDVPPRCQEAARYEAHRYQGRGPDLCCGALVMMSLRNDAMRPSLLPINGLSRMYRGGSGLRCCCGWAAIPSGKHVRCPRSPRHRSTPTSTAGLRSPHRQRDGRFITLPPLTASLDPSGPGHGEFTAAILSLGHHRAGGSGGGCWRLAA